MSYTSTRNALAVACLTPEGRAKTCGYWYCVSDHGTALTAFRTRAAFIQWMDARNLCLAVEVPVEGAGAYLPIIGAYRSAMHLDRAEWDALAGQAFLHMSNARYTMAVLARDHDGLVCEHYLNPNVSDRPEFDHAACRALEDAGHADRLPRPSSGRLPYNPRYVAYAAAHGRTVDDMLAADRVAWPGGHMCGFILWNRARIAEFSKVQPEAFCLGSMVDHAAYDAWLAAYAERAASDGEA